MSPIVILFLCWMILAIINIVGNMFGVDPMSSGDLIISGFALAWAVYEGEKSE